MSSVRVFWPRYSREELLAQLRAGLGALGRVLELRQAVLFGSWAKGRQTAASDVDLLVVYGGPHRPDAYGLCRRHVRVRGLEPHVYSEEEFAALAPVLDPMIRGGIPVPLGAEMEHDEGTAHGS